MYKRQDWLHLHGQDGGDSSDDSSSEQGTSSDAQDGALAEERDRSTDAVTSSRSLSLEDTVAVSNSSEEPAGSEQDSEADEVDTRRLQDLSESDYDDGEQEEDPELTQLKQNWSQARAGHHVKGRALKCRLCPGVLMLNAQSFQQHVASKRHRKQLALDDCYVTDLDPICYGEEMESESDAETHAERLQRTQQHAEQAKQAPLVPTGTQAEGRRVSSRAARRRAKSAAVAAAKKLRPGKRQRADMKAAVFGKPVLPIAGSKSSVARKAKKLKVAPAAPEAAVATVF